MRFSLEDSQSGSLHKRFSNIGNFLILCMLPTPEFGAAVSPSPQERDHAVSLSRRYDEMEVVTSKD